MSFDQTGLGNLTSPAGSKLTLGSLAQSARTKQIRQARLILIVVGVLNMLGGLAIALILGNANNPQINPEALRAAKVIGAVTAVIGLVFVVLGVLTKRYPVPATITALVIYSALVALNLISVASAPQTAGSLLIPILIEIALIRSVRSALAYQREQNAARTMADPLA